MASGASFNDGAFGQIGFAEALGDNRARLERIRIVVERQGDERQPEQALAAHQQHARRAVQHPLDRHGDLSFDFFGRESRQLGDDLHLYVGDVGIGLDRKIQIGLDSVGGNCKRDDDDRQAAPDAELDEGPHVELRRGVRRDCA